MKKNFIILLAVTGLFFISCQKEQQTTEKCTVKHLEWTRDAVMYEINTRQYTPEGTFTAFENHLPRLKELGVDILWFMPVYPISETKRKGTLGSYYAITDYKGINPEFGTPKDFKQLVNKAHDMGFKVILDWVANHTGWDSQWLADHPDWYAKDENGEVIAPYDWTDVAKLDYDNQDMRNAMLEAMKYWIKEFNIDGFRCDMAHEVSTDFWNDARKELDKVKPVFMLAEAEVPELLEHAFDADYNWDLMHIMNSVAKGDKNVTHIYEYLQKTDTLFCPDSYRLNFLTNHDENSWNGTEYERYGQGVKTFAVLTYTINGMPLLYTGQETGMDKRLEFFEKDQVPGWEKNETFAFYQKLNELKHSYPALRAGKEGGEFKRISTSDNENVFVFSRKKGISEVVVFLNLSANPVSFSLRDKLNIENYTDFFTQDSTARIPTELEAWGYKVFVK